MNIYLLQPLQYSAETTVEQFYQKENTTNSSSSATNIFHIVTTDERLKII